MKSYQKLIVDKLAERKQKNPLFSLRALAKAVNISPGQLSSLIHGRRNLTPNLASKLIQKLELSEEDAEIFLRDLLPNPVRRFQHPDLHQLTQDEFSLISDWHNYAILSLGKLKDNQANGKWISHKLGVDPIVAQESLQRLERLGLIKIHEGKFTQISKPLNTVTDIPSTAIRSYHRQNLHLAEEKLELIPVEERMFSSITNATSIEKIEKAKKMIDDFKQKLSKELECANPTHVYTLAIQLFPVSK